MSQRQDNPAASSREPGPEEPTVESPSEGTPDEQGAAEPEDTVKEDDASAQPREEPFAPGMETEKWRDAALRSRAELENFRKRAERERQGAVRYANGSMLESLLPILDHFDLGLEAARKEDEQAVIVQGMTMVKKQLDEFLRANHVETIDGEGEEFDPHLHEAMSQEASDSVESGRVIRQIRRGYRLRDRLLRPAAVIVSSGSGETAGAQPGGAEPEGE